MGPRPPIASTAGHPTPDAIAAPLVASLRLNRRGTLARRSLAAVAVAGIMASNQGTVRPLRGRVEMPARPA